MQTDRKATTQKRLKKLRNSLGLSQVEFSNSIGIEQAHLSMIENGKAKIPMNAFEKIKEKFDVSMDWLFSGNGPMFKQSSQNSENESSTYNILEEMYSYLNRKGLEIKPK